VGKGIRTAPRDALIADSTSAHSFGRAFGFHRMMDTLGAVVGTLLAYTALNVLTGSEGYRIRAVFLFSTVFGVAAVAVLLMFVREPAKKLHSADSDDQNLGPAAQPKRLAIFLVVNTIFYLGMFSYAFFLLRAKSLGFTTVNIPLIYLFYNIIYALTSLPMGRLSDSVGRKPVILMAYSSYAMLCFGFAFASSEWHAWALFGLYGLHSATVNPASRALVAGLSETSSRGTALGIYHTSVGLAALPASLVAGILWDSYGAPTPFLTAGLLALIASLAMLGLSLDRTDHSGPDS
jgi:MFS family permease